LIGEDIVIEYRLASGLGLIYADAVQMDQVILNIALNARDAMPQGGKLFIRTSPTHIDEDTQDIDLTPGDYIMLSIADTGTGMTPEVLAQIFEPFYTTKEVGRGTGLGLATVYGIVKQNHGTIQVYSTPGMGSNFKIFLPLYEPADGGGSDKAPEPHPQPVTPGGHETVLLVEDEPLVSSRVARVLRQRGFEVLVTANGREALALMTQRAQPVDLVLTDVVMPEMNGRELVEKLRQRWADIRVLYMSGYPAEVIAQHGVLEAGIAFIEKPFYTDQIVAKIREVLDA
jgi:two-component system, cell cycle sensor histidine kinase and response regulator CckA